MSKNKKILLFCLPAILISVLFGFNAQARITNSASAFFNYATGILYPLASTDDFMVGSSGATTTAPLFVDSSKSTTYSPKISAVSVCVGGDCKTAWPSGAGGSDAWSTSSPNVYLDGNFKRVGIGDTTPNYALEIGSSSDLGFFNIGSNYTVRPNGAILHSGMITNKVSLFEAIGTSITKGDPSCNSADYTDLLSSRMGITMTNHGIAYYQCGDAASYVYANTAASSTAFAYEIGTNDYVYYTNTNQYPVFRDCYLDAIAYLSIPANQNKKTARDATMVYGGVWADNSSSYGIGRQTTASGATATTTVYGKDVLVSVMTTNSNAATADLYIDGVFNQSVIFQGTGSVTTQQGRAYLPKMIIVRGLTGSVHEIELRKTNADGTMYLNWIAGSGSGQWEKNGPRVYALNIPMGTTAANWSKVSEFNRMIENNVSTIASMGFNVSMLDLAGSLSVVDNVDVHGVHPNCNGHYRIANMLEAQMNEAESQASKQISALPIPNIKWSPSTMQFFTDNANSWGERARLTEAGKFGIATTSPASMLAVEGDMDIGAGYHYKIGGADLSIANLGGGADLTSGTGLTITNGTGVLIGAASIGIASGYNLPTSATTSQWDGFYNTPSSRITAGASCAWSGNTFNCSGEGTTYTAAGTLLNLTGSAFNVKEGTLTNNKACTYVTGTGLVCNSDYIGLGSLSSSATGLTYNNGTGAFSWTSGYEGFLSTSKTKYDAMIAASTTLPYITAIPKTRKFTIASSTLATMWPQSNTASSTVCLAPIEWDVTPTDLVCYLNGGASPTARISLGTTTSIFSNKADVTGAVASTTLSVNNQFSVNEKLCVTIGAVNNNPDSLACYAK
jgi:hypothetical protein